MRWRYYFLEKGKILVFHQYLYNKNVSSARWWFKVVIELSGVQFGLKSYAWFENRTSAHREFDLKSQVWFRTKIARHEVQLLLITAVLKSPKYRTWSVQIFYWWSTSRFKIKLIHFLGGKKKFWKQKLQNLLHDTLCLLFSCNLMGYFKQALKSDWLFCF